MAHALARARTAGVTPERLLAFFAGAQIVPVLTAHPTEVRRKSMIDREMEVAVLLAERDRYPRTASELTVNEAAMRRAVLTLWQTNPLRRTRLRVIDEVANGLSFYGDTFLAELPRFYAELEAELAAEGVPINGGVPSFLRMGSWIGGDRDGNPFVTEAVLRAALRAQSRRAMEHYFDELRLLGAELSLDSRLVGASRALDAAYRRLARPLAQPRIRTLSAGGHRHQRAPRGHGGSARSDETAASSVPLQSMRKGTVDNRDWTTIASTRGRINDAPLYIDDSPNMTLVEIRAKCRRLKQRVGLKMVDHRLPAAHDERQARREPPAGGQRVLARAQAAREGAPGAGHRAVAAEPWPRAARRQAPRPERPARVRLDRAGRRHGHPAAPRERLREGQPACRRGRPHRRQAPQRPHRTVTVAFQGHYSRFTDMAPI